MSKSDKVTQESTEQGAFYPLMFRATTQGGLMTLL